jgi:thioredoxin-like negative regulator of GroEL
MKASSSTQAPIQIESEDELKALCDTHEVVVVMFYADWCGHCKAMKPKFVEAAQTSKGAFALVDDKQRSLMSTYKIRGFPTIKKLHRNGQVTEFTGPRTVDALKTFAETTP